jgi:hypothetical protein
MLLNDAEAAARLRTTLANLERTSADLLALAQEIESSDGLVQRLLIDEEYADRVAGEIEATVARVDRLSRELAEGEGTAARLIHDPQIYQSINDILIGINESRLLRWLVRNRQQKGIEKRYEDAVEAGEVPPLPEGAAPPGEPSPPAGEPAPPAGEEPPDGGPEGPGR